MFNLQLRFEVATEQVEAALKKLNLDLSAALPPPLKTAFARAGVIYMAAMRSRFLGAARGNGTWVTLAISTIANRLRKTLAGREKFERTEKRIARSGYAATVARTTGTLLLEGSSFEILRDTGLLFNSLSLGAPGNVQDFLDHGIRVGTKITYAHFHQDPTIPGRPPQRTILIDPDPPTYDRMKTEINAGVGEIIKEAGLA